MRQNLGDALLYRLTIEGYSAEEIDYMANTSAIHKRILKLIAEEKANKPVAYLMHPGYSRLWQRSYLNDLFYLTEDTPLDAVMFSPEKFELYKPTKHDMHYSLYYHEILTKQLARLTPLNADFLDYFLDHPHLIPEEWSRYNVYFFGTIYVHRGGPHAIRERAIRYLKFSRDWYSRFSLLDSDISDSNDRVAILR